MAIIEFIVSILNKLIWLSILISLGAGVYFLKVQKNMQRVKDCVVAFVLLIALLIMLDVLIV